MPYQPYNGLISLQNNPKCVNTGFDYDGYSRFMAERLTIVDKSKQEVPFAQQPAQIDFLYHMSLFYILLVLKARKMGFSSTALAIAVIKYLTGQNEKCVSMSFDMDASQKQLDRAKHYIRSYEMNRSKALGSEFRVPARINNRKEIIWEGRVPNGHGGYNHFQNTLRVGTAKVDSFGRGDDITFLHLTEVSLARDIESLMAGVGEACLPYTHKILETTANGFNSYKQTWDKAILNENDYAALFYSPYWEYSEEYIEQKHRELGRLGPQEYPRTPVEAFLNSGDPYFDPIALQYYTENAKEPINKEIAYANN